MSRKEIGASPGNIIYTGKKGDDVYCSLFQFRDHDFEVTETRNELPSLAFPDNKTSWLIVNGIHRVDLIKSIGKQFQIHPLVLEDIVHPIQRMKVEEYEDALFLVLKFLFMDEEQEIQETQWSFLVKNNWIICFTEDQGTHFDPIIKRLGKESGVMRSSEADYLCYALIDLVGDHYIHITDKLSEQLEDLEQIVIETNEPYFEDLLHIQKQANVLKKHARQLRDLLSSLIKEDVPVVKDSTRIFLRDVYDHVLYCCDSVDSLVARVNSAFTYYHSYMGLKLNEIMKFLTLIGTIFIPLTFIAGVYGMNFESMPELGWAFGYPLVMGIMALIAMVILIYFKKRKWF